jgi:hypothetical protein
MKASFKRWQYVLFGEEDQFRPSYNVVNRIQISVCFAIALWLLMQALAQEPTRSTVPTCTLEGNVIDVSGGTPVPEAEVAAISRDNFKTSTDAHGHYVLKGIKPGEYAVYARKDHYSLGPQRRAILASGMMLEHFDLQLHTEAAISGRVLDADKNPVANASIDLWIRVSRDGRSTFTFAGSGKTDNHGRYRVAGLSQGYYYIGADRSSFRVTALQTGGQDHKRVQEFSFRHVFYPGEPYLNSATPVHLRISEQLEGVDFFLEKVATFCTTGVTSFTGSTPSEAQVALHLSEISKGWTHTIGDGDVALKKRFEICGLVEEVSYTLFATLWENDTDVSALARIEFIGTQRDAALGFLDLGTLSLQNARPVRGKVVVDTSQSGERIPEGIRVSIDPVDRYAVNNESRTVQVEQSGGLLLKSVLPDDHWLRVLDLPPGYYVEKIIFKGRDLLREPFQPEEGEIEIVISSEGSSVNGHVIDKENRAVQDAQVILARKGLPPGGPVKVRQANQNGDFRFPANVPPGDYRIVAVAGLLESEAENAEIASAYLSQGVDISLSRRGQQTVLLAVLTAH